MWAAYKLVIKKLLNYNAALTHVKPPFQIDPHLPHRVFFPGGRRKIAPKG
jgi:hypothetical protein